MMRSFRQVDVFGEESCSGNPVAVVLDSEGLSDDVLRRFSRWTNLSECAFLLPPQSAAADYRVRFFSLDEELPFAGHPTLGAARAWLDAGGTPSRPGVVIQECGAGDVPVAIDGDLLAFTSPRRTRTGPVDAALVREAISILGVDPERVLDAEWLECGPAWLGLLLDSAETVLSLRPSAAGHSGHWDIGVIGPHRAGAEAAFEARGFFTESPGVLREDPVTGSLNAAAAQWLVGSGRARPPYAVTQGGAIDRRGRVHIRETGGDILVGGRTDVVLAGSVDL